ncbi:MAG TPA: hypothetical protein VHU22_23940 [Xanthobacteraceae bacterium]|jgi:hypothetical protein|nr:hypothetical protein [Xanthobacteraceae bacterium]
MQQLGFTVLAAIIGFVASLIAEPVQRWIYGPRLLLTFENNNDAYRTKTDMADTTTGQKTADAIYVRLRVENTKPRLAKACRAYLTRVEKRTNDRWEDMNFRDSIQLAWSAQRGPEDGFRALDLPYGVSQFIDLVWVFSPLPAVQPAHNPRHLQPCLAMPLFMHQPIWATDNANYRLTVLVSGDGVEPESHRVILEWNGVYDQIKVSDGGPAI